MAMAVKRCLHFGGHTEREPSYTELSCYDLAKFLKMYLHRSKYLLKLQAS